MLLLRWGELLLWARLRLLHARNLRGIKLALRAQVLHHILGTTRIAGGLILWALAGDELFKCRYRIAVLLTGRAGCGQHRNLALLIDAHSGLPQPMHRKIRLIARNQKIHRTCQRAEDLHGILAAEVIGQLRKLRAGKTLAHDELLAVCGGARADQRCDSRVMQAMQRGGLFHHAGGTRGKDLHTQPLVGGAVFHGEKRGGRGAIHYGQFVQVVLGGKELRKLGHDQDFLKQCGRGQGTIKRF